MRISHYLLALILIPVVTLMADDEKMVRYMEEINKDLHTFELSNGMKCIVRENRSAPVVSVQIWVGSGAVHQGNMLGAGIAHAVEHMFFKGTPKRDVGRIFRDITDAGGKMNAYTSDDRTVYHVDLPARNWKIALDVLSDAIMNPLFPAEEWDKEKQVIMREIAMRDDKPAWQMYDYASATTYTTHPYKYPVIGFSDIFSKVTRQDLVDYYKRNYYPENMITVIVGDIDKAEVEKEIRAAFAGFERKPPATLYIPEEPVQVAGRYARFTAEMKMARLMIQYHITPFNHADTPALDLFGMIAGSGASSRLVSRLKEKEKLVYDISAGSYTPRYPGTFMVTAEFDPVNEEKVIAAVDEELAALLKNDVSSKELDKVRRMTATSLLDRRETIHDQADAFATGQLLTGNPRYDAIYMRRLFELTPAEVRKTAAKYIRPAGRNVCVMVPGDFEENRKAASGKKANDSAAGYKLPVKRMLKNGLTVLIREDRRMPYVYMSISLKGGLLSETENDNGITSLASRLIVKGAGKMSGEEIDALVDSTGGSINPFSGRDTFGLNAKCLPADFKSYSSLMADMLMRPLLDDGEIRKQKDLQIADIARNQEDIVWLGITELRKSLFPGHPYRFDTIGTKDSVDKLTRKQIADYLAARAVSGNAVLAVFGDIGIEEAMAVCEKTFGGIRKGTCVEPVRTPAKPVLPVQTKQRLQKQQALVISGLPGVNMQDERYEELTLINRSLTGLSSDLASNIREKRGLAYYVSSVMVAGRDPGLLAVFSGTREDAVGEVDRLIREELGRMREKGLTDAEFDRALNQVISGYELGLQDNLATAQECAVNENTGLGFMRAFDVRERFGKVTKEDVRKAAGELLKADRVSTVLLLPAGPPVAEKTEERKTEK